MRADYERLLDATIAHLESMKSDGVRFVPVSADILASLREPVAPGPGAGVAGPIAAEPPASVQVNPAPVSAGPVSAPKPGSAAARESQRTFLPLEIAPVGAGSEPLSRETKEAAMQELRMRAMVCQKCSHLAASRKSVVFGVGDIHSPLMFVGEAPGADEDEQGEPFVGRAGQLLTRIIQTMGYSRDTVYIANILKCRPDTPGQTAGNRKPTSDEMKTCLPYLLAQIDIIRPKAIVALGATAIEGLMGRVQGITRLRGQWLRFRDIPLMPTYHPAYLLRNQSMAVKREVWEDMLKVLEQLGQPISEKQRGYFLKG
jgi:DNA polymerase